jgi:hypothetical protein
MKIRVLFVAKDDLPTICIVSVSNLQPHTWFVLGSLLGYADGLFSVMIGIFSSSTPQQLKKKKTKTLTPICVLL